MKYTAEQNRIVISGAGVDPDATFGCGQCFRFDKNEDGSWSGVAFSRSAPVSREGDSLVITGITEEEFNTVWRSFLDLDRDYDGMHAAICADPVFAPFADAAAGIHILKQDFWEALASFIFSQNNNIPRIKGIVSRFCEGFGERVEGGYAFPTAERTAALSREDLASLRCGFRDKYLLDAAEKVASGEITEERLASLPTDEARELLMKIKGVGVKVADCTLLYGCGRMEVFPRDVWIKRIEERVMPGGVPEALAPYAGILQQYLYHAGRNLGI